MKNKFIKISFSLLAVMLMFSCENDDNYTGDSTISATSPAVTVSLGFTNTQTLVEQEASYDFTVTLNEIQAVDVVVNLEQTGGTATNGEDFTMPSTVTIPSGTLSASDVITILQDELPEDTETATILIGTGSEVNVSGVNSETVTFNIANLTDGDLVVGMTWAASGTVTNNFGEDIDPYELADLRLLLTDSPYTTIIETANETGAETFVLAGDAPDGDYSFVADFFAAMTEINADVDITLSFDQVGAINGQTHSFKNALNTTDSCIELNYVMATVTKSGDSYSFAEVGQKSSIDFSEAAGTWSGNATWFDYFGYTSEVETFVDANGDLYVNGIAFQWFQGWWGEVIVSNTAVKIMITDPCTGAFVIEEQPYIEATYNGAPQPSYGLSGTGTLVESGGVLQMTIFPVFHQNGGTFSGPEFGGIPFVEYLTLD
jgi:hypothetical protein|tara:strand:- start:518 stop:1810 length:1293 start_codon:yes stop_codon:yes gene_type:complete